MTGSPITRPAPSLPAERRSALLVATNRYDDPSLQRLRAPARDAAELGQVLADPEIGGFTVSSFLDCPAQEVRLALEDFLADREPGELVLVYLSCHGLLDDRRRLYFAASDTLKNRLATTAVESQWLLDRIEDCRARRLVLILDCCFSGAFARGVKGDAALDLEQRFQGGEGRGRVVLTASRGTEYSHEGVPVAGALQPGSVFTSALVAGLRTGAADLDRDGYVSVDDAYGYVYEQIRDTGAAQTPQRWLYGSEGSVLLARSPGGVTVSPTPLPEALRAALDSPLPDVRRGGVGAVGEWLGSDDPAKVLTARQILTEIADNDISRVAALARELLDAKTAETKQEKEDGKPPPRHWPFWPRTRRARIVALSGAAGLLLVIAIIVPITVSSHHSPQPATPLACGGIQDSFASPTLAAGWNETLPNGGTADLASSKLRITAQDGSDYAGSTDTAPTVSRDVTGDFTAQTEVDAAPAHTYQGAGLVVSADNGNYVRLERGYGDVGAIAFEHMQDGSYTKVASPFSADQSRGSELARTDATAVQLMLHRTGGTLRASWRAVGSTTWQDVGEVPAPDQSGAPLHVGLAVVNRAQPPQGDPARTPFSASFSSADITCA